MASRNKALRVIKESRSLQESVGETEEIVAKETDPLKAAHEIVEILHNDPIWGENLKDVKVVEDYEVHRGTTVAIVMEIAFEASLGFMGGEGIFGNEGFGKAGPVFDNENSGVFLEPINSHVVGVYEKEPMEESCSEEKELTEGSQQNPSLLGFFEKVKLNSEILGIADSLVKAINELWKEQGMLDAKFDSDPTNNELETLSNMAVEEARDNDIIRQMAGIIL